MSSSEKEKFISIIRDNKRLLLKVIRSYCKNPEDWKDLEQEILIQLWKALKSYDDRYKLSTWMYRIALNVAISYYRKEKKRKNDSPLDDVVFQMAEDHSQEEMNERTRLLYEFINQLDKLDRALIILYLEEKSYAEISEILGISETNVSTKINRIKNKLKTSFTNLNPV